MATVKRPSRVTLAKDDVQRVLASITHLVSLQVLIGIPERTSERENYDGVPVNNARLGYIHEFGSPANNIPARPFLIPGVEKATKPALEVLQKGATSATGGDKAAAERCLNAAGIIGMNFARDEIQNGNFVPLSPITVERRRYSRQTKSMRPAEKKYLKLIDQGYGPQAAQDAAGIKPLINTGQLRNSLTYVVRQKK